jgi:hypothetical protein
MNKPGPKLNRTETVTIRLDIDTKSAAIESAWESRRTLSSWIESVIIEKLQEDYKNDSKRKDSKGLG